MKIIKASSRLNSLRGLTKIQNFLLTKTVNFNKNNSFGVKSFKGRSSSNGRITVRHKGGGVKRTFKLVNNSVLYHQSIVISIGYNYYNSCFLATTFNFKSLKFFQSLSINNVLPGSLISSSNDNLYLGNRLQLKSIPICSLISNLAVNKRKSTYIKSPGTYGQIIQKDFITSKIRLPSKKVISVFNIYYATLGVNDNSYRNKITVGTAGRSRRISKRPATRGIAMNPVDHPHGGRTNGGCPSVTPWGLPTKCGFHLKKRKKQNG
jgi:large subunit ribosomal protein L2